MTMMTKILAGGAGLAALAAAAPSAAQYAPYGYSNPYAYGSQYGSQYAYGGYGVNTNVAAQQCTAAVQNRLMNRRSIGGILGAFLGANTASNARIVSITQATPTRTGVRVRGLASSGRYAYNSYGQYGVGAYGALGYGQPDLSFKCDVDYSGRVRNIDIHRRR